MSAHSVAELITARRAIRDYREAVARIEEYTTDPKLERSMPLTVRMLRRYARIARRAAIAEEVDPEWRT